MSQPLCPAVGVFVADSSSIASRLLAEAIAKDPSLLVQGFSSDPVEIARLVPTLPVDVLLFSARMQEEPTRGVSLFEQLRKELPNLKGVLLLDSSRPELVVLAFRSGASGVFSRNTELHLLMKCVRAVHGGEIWANHQELGFVISALTSAIRSEFDSKRLAPLSAREKEVVTWLIEGLTNREIAQKLSISQHTVKNYIFKIFEKLGVSNRVELAFQVLSTPAHSGPMNLPRAMNTRIV